MSKITYVPGGRTEAKLAAEYFCKALLHFSAGSFVNASFWLKEAAEMADMALEDWGRPVASHHVVSIAIIGKKDGGAS